MCKVSYIVPGVVGAVPVMEISTSVPLPLLTIPVVSEVYTDRVPLRGSSSVSRLPGYPVNGVIAKLRGMASGCSEVSLMVIVFGSGGVVEPSLTTKVKLWGSTDSEGPWKLKL